MVDIPLFHYFQQGLYQQDPMLPGMYWSRAGSALRTQRLYTVQKPTPELPLASLMPTIHHNNISICWITVQRKHTN